MTTTDALDIHLLRVPVALWSRSQEHSDELLREFALIATAPQGEAGVPARLTQLVQTLNQTYAGVGTEQEAQLYAAADDGVAEVDDLVFVVPPAVSEACIVLGALLDEADAYCQAGEHLLTLTTPPELVRFRRWYLDQFVDQVAGRPAVPWPDYAPA